MSDLLVQIIGLIAVFAACLTTWRAYDMLRYHATILFECWLALPLGDKSALFLALCLCELGEFLPQYGAVSRRSAACLPKQLNSCQSLFNGVLFQQHIRLRSVDGDALSTLAALALPLTAIADLT